MEKFNLMLVVVCLLISCQAKNDDKTFTSTQAINVELSNVLDSMRNLDQKYRSSMGFVSEKYGWDSYQMDSLWRHQAKVDSSNIHLLEEIIEEHGFPGRSLVGEDGSRAAFLILQHSSSDTMDKYYEVVLEAGENGELAMSSVAMYEDRVLMRRGEQQIYGTQIRTERVEDPETGNVYDSSYVWPIKDSEGVNKRRLSVGLNTSVEEYASGFGVDYNSEK